MSEEEDPFWKACDFMVWTLVADKIRGHRFQRLEIQITRVNSHFIPNDAQLELEGDLVATALHVVAKRDLLMEGGSRKWGATFWLVRSFQVDGFLLGLLAEETCFSVQVMWQARAQLSHFHRGKTSLLDRVTNQVG